MIAHRGLLPARSGSGCPTASAIAVARSGAASRRLAAETGHEDTPRRVRVSTIVAASAEEVGHGC